MRGQPAISGVYQMGPADAPVGTEAQRRNDDARRTAWHAHGLVVIDPEDIEDDFLRQAVINIGNQRYGRRQRRGA